MHQQKPKIGIVLIPEKNELWFGILGVGAWFENRDGAKNDIGKLVKVKIEKSNQNTLYGKIKKKMKAA